MASPFPGKRKKLANLMSVLHSDLKIANVCLIKKSVDSQLANSLIDSEESDLCTLKRNQPESAESVISSSIKLIKLAKFALSESMARQSAFEIN